MHPRVPAQMGKGRRVRFRVRVIEFSSPSTPASQSSGRAVYRGSTRPQASSPAQQLLQAAKGRWSPPPKGASLRAAAAKAAEPAAFPKVPDSRRKSLRQFSITTALNTLNRMVHAPAERPALHISSPVLISSSNPTVATQSSEKAELPCGTPLQVSTSYYPTAGPLGPPAAIVTLPHLQHQGPAYLCVALHSYAAHGPDELELQKGEGVRVFGKDQDGWLRGMSLVTGRVGLFPSNYEIQSLRAEDAFPVHLMDAVHLVAVVPGEPVRGRPEAEPGAAAAAAARARALPRAGRAGTGPAAARPRQQQEE
ncbi:hypothetical protein DV515_00015826 [Chloebia gouldiae]|uniref:SH3 domain-containing protein n=1 Tax=Chloebia gouldiae TaxID=44316 RepID=A0A3L8RU72_CHLGU|nr:hypothetical protein DV515_00015826 [Chloebia gouldiae]